MINVSESSVLSAPPRISRLDQAGRSAWSAVGILALAIILALVIPRLGLILVPVVAATIFAALLLPIVERLQRFGLRPLLAVVVVVFGSLGLLIVGIVLLAPAVTTEFDALRSSLDGGLTTIQDWLTSGPLGLSDATVTNWGTNLRSQTGSITSSLARSAVAKTPLVLDIIAGCILTLVLTFFFIKDGPTIAVTLGSRLQPTTQRRLGDVWTALTGYSQGLVVNGAVNATMLGAALAIMGIPLALPIAVITALASFVPVAGAVVSGVMAALIALVASGPTAAGVVIAVTILIHHLEGYVIGPLVIGRRIGLHPVVLILAFLLGVIVAGIPGGFLAGPIAAATSGWFAKSDTLPTDTATISPFKTAAIEIAPTLADSAGPSAGGSAHPNKGKKP